MIPDPYSHVDFELGQILNVHKPAGWTSFDVVRHIRTITKVKKVGHAGTLDPFATGVLLVCTGKATKRVSELMGLEKEYEAEIELGKTTDTHDPTGTVLRTRDSKDISADQVRAVCGSFKGTIMQTPPMFSALKVNGQRLYKLARQGKTINRPPRRVTVHKLELARFNNPMCSIRVTCSKGTYIRVLAHDIGEKLGCGAYLRSLVRTRVGQYSIEDAYTLRSN